MPDTMKLGGYDLIGGEPYEPSLVKDTFRRQQEKARQDAELRRQAALDQHLKQYADDPGSQLWGHTQFLLKEQQAAQAKVQQQEDQIADQHDDPGKKLWAVTQHRLKQTQQPLVRAAQAEADAIEAQQRQGQMSAALDRITPNNAFVRETIGGALNAAPDFISMAARLTGNGDAADTLNRQSQEFGQVREDLRANDMSPWLSRMYGGAVQNITQMAGTPGGAYGKILGAAGMAGNQALTTAEDAGLKGNAKLRYAGTQALFEGGVAAIFQKLFPGLGAESRVAGQGVAAQTWKQLAKNVGKDALAEMPEEAITSVLQDLSSKYEGVSDLTPEDFAKNAGEAAIQAAMMSGIANTPSAARLFIARPSRENYKALPPAMKLPGKPENYVPPGDQRKALAEQMQGQSAPPSDSYDASASSNPQSAADLAPNPVSQPGEEVIPNQGQAATVPAIDFSQMSEEQIDQWLNQSQGVPGDGQPTNPEETKGGSNELQDQEGQRREGRRQGLLETPGLRPLDEGRRSQMMRTVPEPSPPPPRYDGRAAQGVAPSDPGSSPGAAVDEAGPAETEIAQPENPAASLPAGPSQGRETQPEPKGEAVSSVPVEQSRDKPLAETIAPLIREQSRPVNDIHGEPTGWLMYRDAKAVSLVHPTENKIVPFYIDNQRSGTEQQRRLAEAQAYAIDNPVEQGSKAEAPPVGDLVVKPVFDRPARTDQIGSSTPKVEAPPQPRNEFLSSMPAMNAKKAETALEQQVRTAGNFIKRKDLIEHRVGQGATIVEAEVEDDAQRKKLEGEYKKLATHAPIGNEKHPDTIRLRELKDKLGGKITKRERRLQTPEGHFTRESDLTKTGMDYAAWLIGQKTQPTGPENQGSGLRKPFPITEWRKAADTAPDSYTKNKVMRAVAEKSKDDGDLSEVVDRVDALVAAGDAEEAGQVMWSVMHNNNASAATKKRAEAVREKYLDGLYEQPTGPAPSSPTATAPQGDEQGPVVETHGEIFTESKTREASSKITASGYGFTPGLPFGRWAKRVGQKWVDVTRLEVAREAGVNINFVDWLADKSQERFETNVTPTPTLEPWQMTPKQYAKSRIGTKAEKQPGMGRADTITADHRAEVRKAFNQGQDVPWQALEPYLDDFKREGQGQRLAERVRRDVEQGREVPEAALKRFPPTVQKPATNPVVEVQKPLDEVSSPEQTTPPSVAAKPEAVVEKSASDVSAGAIQKGQRQKGLAGLEDVSAETEAKESLALDNVANRNFLTGFGGREFADSHQAALRRLPAKVASKLEHGNSVTEDDINEMLRQDLPMHLEHKRSQYHDWLEEVTKDVAALMKKQNPQRIEAPTGPKERHEEWRVGERVKMQDEYGTIESFDVDVIDGEVKAWPKVKFDNETKASVEDLADLDRVDPEEEDISKRYDKREALEDAWNDYTDPPTRDQVETELSERLKTVFSQADYDNAGLAGKTGIDAIDAAFDYINGSPKLKKMRVDSEVGSLGEWYRDEIENVEAREAKQAPAPAESQASVKPSDQGSDPAPDKAAAVEAAYTVPWVDRVSSSRATPTAPWNVSVIAKSQKQITPEAQKELDAAMRVAGFKPRETQGDRSFGTVHYEPIGQGAAERVAALDAARKAVEELPFDLETAKAQMDKRGYSEHGGHKFKVVPYPGTSGSDVKYAVERWQEKPDGSHRSMLPEKYDSLERAQHAAINLLADEVGGQGRTVKPSIETPDIPKYERTGPASDSPEIADAKARLEGVRETQVNARENIKKAEADKKGKRRGSKPMKALDETIEYLRNRENEAARQDRAIQREIEKARIEDVLENPASYDHYLAAMANLYDDEAAEHRDARDEAERRDGYRRTKGDAYSMHQERVDAAMSKSDEFAIKLMDRAKELALQDGTLNNSEATNASNEAYRDFRYWKPETLAEVVQKNVEKVRNARKAAHDWKIDKLTDLSGDQRSAYKAELADVAASGKKDWWEKSEEVVSRAEAENKVLAEKKAKVEAAEKERVGAEKAEQERLNQIEHRKLVKRQALESRYWRKLKERASGTWKKGTYQILNEDGSKTDVEGDVRGDFGIREVAVETRDEGGVLTKTEKSYPVTHIPSGFQVAHYTKKVDSRAFAVMMSESTDWSHVKSDADMTDEDKAKGRRLTKAFDETDLSKLESDEQAAALKTGESHPEGIVADQVLGSVELEVGLEGQAKIVSKLKELAAEVPEFAYNPVFTVEHDSGVHTVYKKNGDVASETPYSRKALVFKDGMTFRFAADTFNLENDNLRDGDTIGIDLNDIGLKKIDAGEMVEQVLSNNLSTGESQGFKAVTLSKDGDSITAKWKPTPYAGKLDIVTVVPGPDGKWIISEGAKSQGGKIVQQTLDRIRWVQPGQAAKGQGPEDVQAAPSNSKEDFLNSPENVADRERFQATAESLPERAADSLAYRVAVDFARNGFTPRGDRDPEFNTVYDKLEDKERMRVVKRLGQLGAINVVTARKKKPPTSRELTLDVAGTLKLQYENHNAVATNRHVPFTDSDAYKRATGQSISVTLSEKAAKSTQEMKDAAKEFMDTLGGATLPSIGSFSPETLKAFTKLTAKVVKAGVLNFADYSASLAVELADLGQDVVESLRPLMKQTWARMAAVDKRLDPATEEAVKPEKVEASGPTLFDEQGPPVEPPKEEPAKPSEPSLDEGDTTSIKNAVVDELRAERGKPEMETAAPESQQEWLDDARKRIDDDPTLTDRLVDKLHENAVNLEPVEIAALQIHQRTLVNAYRAASDALFEAKKSGGDVDVETARTAVEALETKLQALEEATKAAGTQWGRAGVARQIELAADYSLAGVTRRAMVAKGGSELTDAERDQIKALHEKYEQTKTTLDEYTKKVDELEARLRVQEQINQEKAKPKPKESAEKSAARAKVEDAWKAFSKAVGGKFYSNPLDPEALAAAIELTKAYVNLGVVSFKDFIKQAGRRMGPEKVKEFEPAFKQAWEQVKAENPDALKPPAPKVNPDITSSIQRAARELARWFVAEAGITDVDELVDAVHEALKPDVPGITRRQTMDAISGYGEFTELSKDQIDAQLRDLRGQMQQLGKLDDMAQGAAPRKTGQERREPSDKERQLIQQVNEAKRRGGYTVTDPEAQLKTALDARKTYLKNRMTDLQLEIDTRQRIVKDKTPSPTDLELDALRAEYEQVKAAHEAMFPKPGITDAHRLELAVAAAERNEKYWTERLEKAKKGDFTDGKVKTPPLTGPELDAIQARVDAVKQQYQELKDLANPKKTAAEREDQRYRTWVTNATAKLLDRIARKDFAPPPKRPDPQRSAEALKLRFEHEQAKKAFADLYAEWQKANRHPVKKAIDFGREVLNTSRSVMTSFDLSAVARQGGWLSAGHPGMAVSASGEMLKAFTSEKELFRIEEELAHRPNAGLYKKSKLALTGINGTITNMEEAYMGQWAKHIPGVAGSERAYVAYLNVMRANTFDAMAASLSKGGALTDGEAKIIANYVNVASGRGSDLGGGKLASAAAGLASVFFSPRYVVSRFQLALGQPLLTAPGQGSLRVRALVASEYARSLTGLALFYGATAAALTALYGLHPSDDEEKWSIEEDPRSSDFGKIRIGNTRIDPLAGLSQTIVVGTRLAVGEKKKPSGMVVPIVGDHIPFGGATWMSTAGRFIQSKLAPAISIPIELRTGVDYNDEKVTPRQTLERGFTPLAVKEIYDVMTKQQNVPRGVAISMLALLGFGAQSYPDRSVHDYTSAAEDAISRPEKESGRVSQKAGLRTLDQITLTPKQKKEAAEKLLPKIAMRASDKEQDDASRQAKALAKKLGITKEQMLKALDQHELTEYQSAFKKKHPGAALPTDFPRFNRETRKPHEGYFKRRAAIEAL